MSPRKVVVVCVDDKEDNQDALRTYEHLFEIQPVEGMGDARLAIMRAREQADRPAPVDLFLVDVDMSDNSVDHDGFDFGSGGEKRLVPYGPLLVQPFVNVHPTTQFVPYSAHWDDPAIRDNGYVLLPLSLLLTAIDGKEYTLEMTRDAIQERLSKAKLPSAALMDGLRRYRVALLAQAKSGAIRLHNIARVRAALKDLIATNETHAAPLLDPENNRELGFEWMNKSNERIEYMSVSSVFADLFAFRHRVTRKQIEAIDAALSEWSPLSTDVGFATDEALCQAAMEVLAACVSDPAPRNVLRQASDRHPLVVERGCDVHLLRRSTILLCWVIAWHQRRHRGETNLLKTWKDFFHRADDLGGGGAEHWIQEYLASRDLVSYETYCTPLWPADANKKTFVRASYLLETDAAAHLMPRDQRICTMFARDHLGAFLSEHYPHEGAGENWNDTSTHPYPKWMVASTPIRWDLQRQRPASARVSRRSTTK